MKKQDFTQKIAELVELAKGEDNQVSTSEIQEFFKDDKLTDKQQASVLTMLAESGIDVMMADDADFESTENQDVEADFLDGDDIPEVDLLAEPTDEDIALVAADEGDLLEPTDENFENDDDETVELDAVDLLEGVGNRRSCAYVLERDWYSSIADSRGRD